MATFMSPLDPIFWTHHAMLDYCWVDWDIVRNNRSPSDPTWGNLNFTDFVDETGNSVASVAGFSVLLPLIFYQYEPSQIGASVARMPFLRTQREMDQMKSVIRQGASAELALRARFRLARPIRVDVSRAGAAAFGIDAPVVQEAMQAAGGTDRVLLLLGQVEQPAAADFFVRVFINAPSPVSAATPISDPHYAGSFAFFLDSRARHSGMPMRAGFTVDVTDTLRRVGTGGRLNVQLVAVPYPGRTITARSFSVGSLELGVARVASSQPG
jgi:tyrosinase